MAELIPSEAWDTHIHVFDPDKFPYAPIRSYTPKAAQLDRYPSHITGCKKIVVVHASMQGTSPAALTDTLQKQHHELRGYTLRGLANIDPNNVTDAELDELHNQSVRGVRLHKMAWGHGTQSGGADIMGDVKAIADKVARLGWVIDVFCPLKAWAMMADGIRQLDPRVKMVADHFGGSFPGDEETPEFQTFLQLIRDGRIWAKISGFERLYHGHRNGMDALEPMAKAIIEAAPNQVIFGTDWPHTQLGVTRQGKMDEQRLTEVEGFREVPDADHIRKLRTWISDNAVWQKLFVENAQALFT